MKKNIKKLDKLDRFALHMLAALHKANRQSSNPTVYFRCLQTGLEGFLAAEGHEVIANLTTTAIDESVLFACFNVDPNEIMRSEKLLERTCPNRRPCTNKKHTHS